MTKIKHFIPHAPPLAGKGLVGKRLRTLFPDMFIMGTGQEFREKLKTDPHFNSKYAEKIRCRELVPDEDVIQVVSKKFKETDATRIYWDGVFRTAGVVGWAIDEGILTPENTLFVVLHATKTTCFFRHEHRRLNKPDGDRPDDDFFENGYRVFQENDASVRSKFRSASIKPVHIDANGDVDTLDVRIVPDVVAAVNHFWGKSTFYNKPPVTPHSALPELSPRDRLNRVRSVQLANLRSANPRFAAA